MIPCSSCNRHYQAVDALCPFCAKPSGSSRALKSVGAALTTVVLAACYGGWDGDGKWDTADSGDTATTTTTDPTDFETGLEDTGTTDTGTASDTSVNDTGGADTGNRTDTASDTDDTSIFTDTGSTTTYTTTNGRHTGATADTGTE